MWTAYRYKHFAPQNVPWSDVVKGTEQGPAKYKHGLDIEALERNVWQNGALVTNNKPWKVREFDEIIGAKNGQASRWVRVEYSGGTIHGHPITQNEYRRLTR